nr:AN1-type zinc finger protein 2B isoform X1 [Pogona vitticeps]XP_020647673.1 AN1-type zinc finger protein 2B isoform X1 [Pogona vitticeps]XP_020647674.1 AN1-type zinc finger protein 2B isoform X1 [Pogona vitticeps]XP_020647675.1 AN1-type zinc finger protein 2B isoform X1 [Pogona vitticeps]XP_020647676.1 AN1-type zinc finger protein 2B isoform X1 [Pogona vitticeps]
MEFPDLGAHCSEPSCKRLDFLPLKCDACEQLFCTDHVAYAHHSCTSAYKKDVQVPVCPLCSTPIPVKRGEMPDIVVGAHIDQDCKSDPAQRKRKIFTNKCQRPGCKQREMMKVLCDQCHGNFCLKHRHPLDHDCKGTGHSLSKAGNAAIARAQKSAKAPASTTSSSGAVKSLANLPTSSRATEMAGIPQPQSTPPPAVALQNGLSEEEALQRALEMSLAEVATTQPQPHRYSTRAALLGTQEEEDLALARALSASEEEYRQQQQQQQQRARSAKPSNCCLS